ncbi:hypothetical protein AUK40_00585 [Candidatus Wirthbacteria bacterium CG2_30_54_11]|uniref:Baseplate protein J-like domain-containing protein n=1 Tax=Candidatus Wirthbacteria bacterium CG2_30_54_11 TaxID=1817892 RepID=A0A1J5IRF8_9BACT|nr:MAG: hypothetical protein AUK40_00585 [Candidatus Wirthbacteria bacterium CG2_30_54_11]
MSPTPHLHAVYLESKDEITSVIDQIRTCPDPRIALVGADRSALLQSLVNLKLLKRNCELHGKELILITTDPVASALASQISLTCYPKLAAAEFALFGRQVPEPTPRREHPPVSPDSSAAVPDLSGNPEAAGATALPPIRPQMRPEPGQQTPDPKEKNQFVSLNNRGALIVILFAALIPVVALAYAAWAVLPRAEILLVPKTQEFSQDMTVRAAPRFTEVNFFAKEMPLSYAEATEQGSLSAKATQRTELGTKATGIISIFNTCNTTGVTLSAGTEITSYEGKMFIVVNDVKIPGLTMVDEVLYQGVKNKIDLEAKEVGEEYNIEPSNFTIPNTGCSTSKLWGESYDTFSGGASHDAVVLGQNDVDTLRTRLLTDLTNKSRDSMTSQVPEGSLIMPDATESRISAESISAQVGDEVSDFTLSLTIQTRGLALKESDLTDLVSKSLATSIPADFEPLTSQKWDISYTVQSYDLDAKTLDLNAKGKGLVAVRISSPQLKERILGKSKNTAEQVLELYSQNLDGYEVRLTPFYVRSVPSAADKVTITKLSLDEFQTRKSK